MRTLPHCCSELGHLHAGSKLEWLVSSLSDSACFWTISKSEEIKKWSVSVTDLKNCVNRSIFFGGSSPHKNSPPFLSAVQNRRYANQIVVQVWAVWLLIPSQLLCTLVSGDHSLHRRVLLCVLGRQGSWEKQARGADVSLFEELS